MYKPASIATILLVLVLGASCRKPHVPKNRVVPLNASLQKVGDNFGIAAGERLIPETIAIPSGKFMMGSEPGEDAEPNEQPRHSVALDGFEIGRLEVTNAQFESFVKAAGYANEKWREAFKPGLENHPAIYVSWNDAVEYCKWLSQTTNRQYRLPTEAEWEYAAGGAKGVRFSWGDDWDTSITNAGKLKTETVRAASCPPNAFGLFDMTGNVWELCADWYDEKYYSKGIDANPQGPDEGIGRIQRGGALNSPEKYARIAFRSRVEPDARMNATGFRVVAAPSVEANRSMKSRINEAYGKMPLGFEADLGQNGGAQFVSRGNGYGLSIGAGGMEIALLGKAEGGRRKADGEELSNKIASRISFNQIRNNSIPPSPTLPPSAFRLPPSPVLRMRLIDANPYAKAFGIDPLPGKSNYLIGDDPSRWITDIPNYARVKMEEVYPGTDLIYYGNQRELEYDFVLSAGASVEKIAVRYEGAEEIEIDGKGDLLLRVAGGEVRQRKPIAYQEHNGERREVAAKYVLNGQAQVSFEVGSYDPALPLTIDPVISYSTLLGGDFGDQGNDIAVDPSGAVYVVGNTLSFNFPNASSTQPSPGGRQDAFVTKLNAAGTAIVYSTYIGGNDDEFSSGIDADSDGNAYITGDTMSLNFPIRNALQTSNAGSQDVFICKLNPMGNGLVYSTYLGGERGESGFSITVDSMGGAYAVGGTLSTNFPMRNPFQGSNKGVSDVFVVRLNPTGDMLVYSTYLGGSANDFGTSVAVDSAGNAYVTGNSASPDFPLMNPMQGNFGGGNPFGDAFVSKIAPSGAVLVYSTYLGGSGSDFGSAIAIDPDGNAYVTGGTLSMNFPTASAAQSAFGGGMNFGDAFISKLNPSGSLLVYSTYIGGSGDDFGSGIALDLLGSAYATGSTNSENFPLAMPMQNRIGGDVDAFVTKLSPAGNAFVDSTYLGGMFEDRGTSIALDVFGGIYVTGITGSTDFPTKGSLQTSKGRDAFIAKLIDPNAPVPDFMLNASPAMQTVTAGGAATFMIGAQGVNGFALPVNLSAAVTPAGSGVTTSFSSAAIRPGESATLTVNTAATAMGNFTIAVTGSAGPLVRTQTVMLTVNLVPDFALSFNSPQLTVARKQKGQFTVNVNRVGGFAGNVTVTPDAAQAKALKIKITQPSLSTAGGSVSFDFKVKQKAPLGMQQLTFRGSDATGRVRTATLMLTIQ